ncbi:MAG TPA: leucyl aminopeptidase family protein [Bacteroidales bacterium]|nr:leucyl aminopeptidase family protein [Bacteroidales bacterium]
MIPSISRISDISPEKSVVCITGNNQVPEFLKLGKKESDYVTGQIEKGEEQVFLNLYDMCIYFVSLKKEKEHYMVREELRRSAYKLRKLIKSNNHKELVITSSGAYKGAVEDFTEGLLLSMYGFRKYRTEKNNASKKNYPGKLLLHGDIDEEGIKNLSDTIEAVYSTRNLINEPVNHLNAVTLAGEIKKMGDASGFCVEILNKGKIEALKMGGLLAVNKGSVDPPSFSILEWKPEGHVNENPVVLVGKGIVYDTGGLNLKPGESMSGMKGDMAGAAIISGAVYIAAKTRVPLHIIGLVPSTDNRPGGNAYAQGDILTMHNGMTVEVANTDAEGRLILADAISYASKYNPEIIIDVATLTGSAAMTFGPHAIAMMSNADRKYLDLMRESGNDTFERVAELPFWDEYSEGLKSDIADMKNIGNGREAGAIIAGKFLEKFTEYPLIHLDIAGMELLKKDEYYRLKNGTATGLRLLAGFLRKLAEKH